MRTFIAAIAALICCPAFSQSLSNVYQWQDFATLVGGTSQKISLAWTIDVSSNNPSDYFEVLGTWLERPSRAPSWKLLRSQVRFSDTSVATVKQVDAIMQLPGPGHFSFQVRPCLNPVPPSTTPSCSPWANSFDLTVARVNGQPRAWWVYGYLEPLPPPILQ